MRLWPFGSKPSPSFQSQPRDRLNHLNADLPTPVWSWIEWLEANGQQFQLPHADAPCLSLDMVSARHEMKMHLRLEIPGDLIHHWIGQEGYESQIIPLLRTGADGSVCALWQPDNRPSYCFVFLGSEGDCFVSADSAREFITLATMGYFSIECRDVLKATPSEIWQSYHDDLWHLPSALQNWAKTNLGIAFPKTGAALLPYTQATDPFTAFVDHAPSV